MIKRIRNSSLLVGFIVGVIIFIIESVISKKIEFLFSLSFFIGLFLGLLILSYNDFMLSRLEKGYVNKPKTMFVISNLSKFLIYGVVMFLVALFFGEMKVFPCAFGILFHKIIIYYLYLVKDKKDDNKRTVDDLDISNEIRVKLNQNGFHKVNLITEVNRERLMEFLTLEETLKVIESLKKYELFIKGELEAILEDDETVDE